MDKFTRSRTTPWLFSVWKTWSGNTHSAQTLSCYPPELPDGKKGQKESKRAHTLGGGWGDRYHSSRHTPHIPLDRPNIGIVPHEAQVQCNVIRYPWTDRFSNLATSPQAPMWLGKQGHMRSLRCLSLDIIIRQLKMSRAWISLRTVVVWHILECPPSHIILFFSPKLMWISAIEQDIAKQGEQSGKVRKNGGKKIKR